MKIVPYNVRFFLVGLALVLTACPSPATISDFTIGLSLTSLSVTQGQSGNLTVTINRNSFPGGVTLSLEGADGTPAPSGIAAIFDPNPATEGSSAATITVSNTVEARDYSLRIKGTSNGTSKTIPLTLSVKNPPVVTVKSLVGTTPQNPVWAAYQDGEGAWKSLTGNNGILTFSVTDAGGRYGVALICTNTTDIWAQTFVNLYHLTTTEATQLNLLCRYGPTTLPTQVKVTGKVIGLDENNSRAAVGVGNQINIVSYSTPDPVSYEVRVEPGTYSLMASRFPIPYPPGGFTQPKTANKALIVRGLEVARDLTRDVDFGGPEAFDLEGSYTVTTLDTPRLNPLYDVIYATPGLNVLQQALGQASSMTYRAVPSSKRVTGDAYVISVRDTECEGGVCRGRSVGRGISDPQNVAFSLPSFPGSTITATNTSPYLRPKVNWTATGASLQILSYGQSRFDPVSSSSTTLNWLVTLSKGWLDQKTSYTLPDVSDLNGWQTDWGLKNGEEVRWAVNQLYSNLPTSQLLVFMNSSTSVAIPDLPNLRLDQATESGSLPGNPVGPSSRRNSPQPVKPLLDQMLGR